MVKRFYKIRRERKVFFNPNMEIRSIAYGEDVRRTVVEWQAYFFSKWHKDSDKLRLAKQKSIFGTEPQPIGMPSNAAAASEPAIPTLYLDNVKYDVRPDGYVTTNGMRTELNIGSETKGWALISTPCGEDIVNALAVIGKPYNSSSMRLAIYELVGLRPTGKMITSVEYEQTLSPHTEIIAFGRHLFTIHNSRLEYHFCNIEQNELETVAIGTDAVNKDKPWCQYVSSNVVIDKAGTVFWISDGRVYGFTIGYPKALFNIELTAREIPIHVRTNGEYLILRVEDRNTGKQTELFYYPSDGKYQRMTK